MGNVINIYLCQSSLFTFKLSGPCGYWYQHIHHVHTEFYHQGALNTLEILCMLHSVSVSGQLSCCTSKVYSDIQRQNTAFFSLPVVSVLQLI